MHKTIACFLSLGLLLTAAPVALSQDVDDEAVMARVNAAIGKSGELEGAEITVTSVHGYVLLTGQVLNDQQKQEASKAVAFASKAMRRLINELEVVDAVDDSFAASDQELLQRIRDRIEYMARNTHVVVYHGVVHLLGQVTRDEANAAAGAISRMEGVAGIRLSVEYTD